MNNKEIILHLRHNHDAFVKYVNGLADDEFMFQYQDKWTAGQQLKHIYLAVRPVVLAFKLPKLIVRLMFGRSTRPSMAYEGLVKKYQNVLENGGKSSRPFVPDAVNLDQRESICKALDGKVNALCAKVESFSEAELDTMMLPHPLLGRIKMREMLYFTIYHVEHHHAMIKRNLPLAK
jgi:hypothetical protein